MVDNRRKSTKIYIRKRVILVHSLQESYKTLPAPAGTLLFRSVSGRVNILHFRHSKIRRFT